MTKDLVLQVIQDVEWVVGTFVSDESGRLLMYRMPAEYDEEQLRRAACRIASIVRCAEHCELDVEQCDFSLNRHQLLTKRFVGGLLCVLVQTPVSRRALDMATRLAVDCLPKVVAALPPEGAGQDAQEEPTSRYSFSAGSGLGRRPSSLLPRGFADRA
jgi:hypothetical protein